MNKILIEHIKAQSQQKQQYNDLVFNHLQSLGFEGALNEKIFKYLRSRGLTGSLSDMVNGLENDEEDEYALFDQYLTIENPTDYKSDIGVSSWVNRASGGMDYDLLQVIDNSQPTLQVNGLDFNNSTTYLRCANDTIANALQTYIANSQQPNFSIAQSLTLSDGNGNPTGFNTDGTFWAIVPKSGNGYLWAQLLPNGQIRTSARNTLNNTLVSFNLDLSGRLGENIEYEIGWYFHDGVLDTLFGGNIVDTRAFNFSPYFSSNNPFVSSTFIVGARIINDSVIASQLSGRIHKMGYKNAPTEALVLPI